MLSLILSWLFRLGFVIAVLGGMIDLIVQVQQKPITVYERRHESMRIGEPGLSVRAYRSSSNERPAPDTLIKYNIIDSATGQAFSNGEISSFSYAGETSKARFDLIRKSWETKGSIIKCDTQVYTMRYMNMKPPSEQVGLTSSSSSDTLPDGRFLLERTITDGSGKRVGGIKKDTFTNMSELQMFVYTQNRKNEYGIRQAGSYEETIRLTAKSNPMQVLFIAYGLADYFFTAWLLWLLSRLFRNFYRRDYFSLGNVRLLRSLGLCLLIPQLLHTAFFWGLLNRIQPAKFFISETGEVKLLTQYQFISGINGILVVLGLGMLILSYIFKDGLLLKEDSDLHI